DESDLDRRVDDAARELTEGEAPASFKARVLQRIEQHNQPRWTPAWLLSTAAAAVCLVLVVMLMRGGHPDPSPQAIATRGGGAATGVESVAPPVTHVAADPPTVAATAKRAP